MNLRCCSQEGVHRFYGTPEEFGTANNSSASIGDRWIDGQDSALKADGQLVAQPIFQSPLAFSAGHTINSVAQLGQRDYAQKDAVFVGRVGPPQEACVRPGLEPLGNYICIEKKTHRSIFRKRPFGRCNFRPDPRSGEDAKKSASVPTRLVLRFHSSASTTMTAVRPFRVTVCGPSDIARSMTSLNFALAWATVQVCALTVDPFQLQMTIIVIIVITGFLEQLFSEEDCKRGSLRSLDSRRRPSLHEL